MCGAEPIRISLRSLGATDRLAIRKVLSEFRYHGWRDVDGAAVALVRRLRDSGGEASARSLAAAAPANFLLQNHLHRAELERALSGLADQHR